MQEKTRATVGYAAVGLVLGLFIFPWFYILTTRMGIAKVTDPIWAAIYFLVILGPGLLFALLGPRRARENPSA